MRLTSLVHTVLATALATVGCSDGDEPLDTSSTTQEMVALEGTFEFNLDAPWRLDPYHDGDGNLVYPKLPIQMTFLDEYVWDRDTDPDDGKRLGDFCSVAVKERFGATSSPVLRYHWGTLADVERIGKAANGTGTAFWPFPDDDDEEIPTRRVCGRAIGETCTSTDRRLRDTSEWHGRVDHTVTGTPGESKTYEVIARVSRAPGQCSDPEQVIVFRNWVRVDFGAKPLPRFDDSDWLYSDLHYHSQGTDNEGEAGHSYRGTIAAMAAIGVDVIFATEHASNTAQAIDADVFEDYELGYREVLGIRDMSARRFDHYRDNFLAGPDGANTNAAALWTHPRPAEPRIYLSGEVDAIPVVPQAPTLGHDHDCDGNGNCVEIDEPEAAWYVPYGNPFYDNLTGLRFDLGHMCDGWRYPLDFGSCPPLLGDVEQMFVPMTNDDGETVYGVRDVQGMNQLDFFGRQHVLFLPGSPVSGPQADPDGEFVASTTTDFGGATRRLTDVAGEIGGRGIGFLAHPIGGGGGDLGPGFMPYTLDQLTEAFELPSIAGLQFWNENNRLKSGPCDGSAAEGSISQCLVANDWREIGYDHIETEWGIPVDGHGHEPGWDNRLFEYIPVFDLETWTWKRTDHGIDHQLHHGAYTWDRMLRWGLDLGRTNQLEWLAPGEPRKVFMAGGSDAHGDFNYRREGYLIEPTGTSDTALGAVRNLVFTGETVLDPDPPCDPRWGCPPPPPTEPGSQGLFVDRLLDGRFMVTDGPALRIAIDRNGTGVIDEGDLIMGDTVHLDDTELDGMPLLVQWESTEDWGPVAKIDLYVGVDASTGDLPHVDDARARTFAPTHHGVRRELDELTAEQIDDDVAADTDATDCGAFACQMADGYWLPAPGPREQLRIIPTVGSEMAGTELVMLDLTRFRLANDTQGTRFYVRAFARTRPMDPICVTGSDIQKMFAEHQGRCIDRYAFTNPIWVLQSDLDAAICPYQPGSLDFDGDGFPDSCDGNPAVPNAGAWSMRAGGIGIDDATAVAHADDGDVFVGGNFRGTASIDTYGNLTAASSSPDGYIARYASDAPSEALWLRQLGGTGAVAITDLAATADGELLVAGWFNGQLTLGGNSFTADSDDAFVALLDGETGMVAWSRQLGGIGRQLVDSVAVDPDGNVIVGGTYRNEVKFLPGLVRLDGDLTDDCFVAWYGPSGNITMARPIGGTGSCIGRSVAAGTAPGVAHFSGQFGGQVIFDPWYDPAGTTVTALDGTDGFVVTFANTDHDWHAHLGGSGTALGTAIAVDPIDGDVVVAGSHSGTLVVAAPSGTATIAQSSNYDPFVVRFGPDGALDLSGSFTLPGPGSELLSALDVGAGEIALGGTFNSASWTLGSSTLTLTGTSEGWIAMLTPAGVPWWSREIGVTAASFVYTLDLSPSGWLGVAGHFSGSARLDDRRDLVTAGSRDGWWARIDPQP